MTKPLLEIKNLKKQYPIYGPMGKMFRPKTHMNAVAGLSLEIHEKETYGPVVLFPQPDSPTRQIGRASCRERV